MKKHFNFIINSKEILEFNFEKVFVQKETINETIYRKSEKLLDWLLKGFNANIYYLWGENEITLKNDIFKSLLYDIFDQTKEMNIEFSIKSFSIFYNNEKKVEDYYSYFEKKGSFLIFEFQ